MVDDGRRWSADRDAKLAAQRQRQKVMPMAERLLETIAWSATLLADDLRRNGKRPHRPLALGLGPRRS